ncbi:MAG: polysaccharide deacetylase family protein [Dehalococcoidia bacterium]|nr:MAG: polysaccharide deacetylase family protein [Dehalococcoidia bacterium]
MRDRRMFVLRSVLVLALLPVVARAGIRGLHWSDVSITHADRTAPVVAITFDDGLNGPTTLAAAETLERYNAPGTFFVVARTITEQPDLAKRLRDHGHLLANHSYDHPRAKKTDLRYTQASRAQATFFAAYGECPTFFRPPWGVQTPWVNGAVKRDHMRTVLWDVEVADWDEKNPERLAANVLAKVRPGSIILLHDGEDGHIGANRSTTVAALPAILEGLKARGLTPVRLDTLLGMAGYQKDCG